MKQNAKYFQDFLLTLFASKGLKNFKFAQQDRRLYVNDLSLL